MRRIAGYFFLIIAALVMRGDSSFAQMDSRHGYLGFDRNDYPGDAAMSELRNVFSFAGYWLTPTPGAKTNSWNGKRKIMTEQKYGFLLLARGREGSAIHNIAAAQKHGTADAREAARTAKIEGFASGAIIFVDVEDGGRLTDAYHAYLRAWADELVKLGFRAGVYCSGISVNESGGAAIVTADDIRAKEAPREFAYWVFNDACPPSPGCVSVSNPPLPSASGVKDARVWQFVRSPREKETASQCGGYAADENCYAGVDAARKWHLDMNVAASADPSFSK
jgi:Domain of unknown function (DUF1906)